jgi:hypothetical protein
MKLSLLDFSRFDPDLIIAAAVARVSLLVVATKADLVRREASLPVCEAARGAA